VLTVNAGYLQYDPNNTFEFITTLTYNGTTYMQMLNIDVSANISQNPLPQLDCRVRSLCKTDRTYKRIASSNDIILQGACVSGCSSAMTVYYNYTIYENVGSETNLTWALCNSNTLSNTWSKTTNIIIILK
jgi:hypothetical protein